MQRRVLTFALIIAVLAVPLFGAYAVNAMEHQSAADPCIIPMMEECPMGLAPIGVVLHHLEGLELVSLTPLFGFFVLLVLALSACAYLIARYIGHSMYYEYVRTSAFLSTWQRHVAYHTVARWRRWFIHIHTHRRHAHWVHASLPVYTSA